MAAQTVPRVATPPVPPPTNTELAALLFHCFSCSACHEYFQGAPTNDDAKPCYRGKALLPTLGGTEPLDEYLRRAPYRG